MTNIIEKNEHLKESKHTPLEQNELSPNTETFDIETFVHTSKTQYGNTVTTSSHDGIDMEALGSVVNKTQTAGKKLSRQAKKQAKKELAAKRKESRKKYVSVKSQLKDRDKELSDKTADYRRKRATAKSVLDYIGYNAMHQDGICEVEESLFSASISFEDTSYHSVRDEQQKAMFSGLTRLYDQFGADTLVQISVINTPLLKEEIGNRRFFQTETQKTDAAKNDATVFNQILNDKVKEGVSNIRRHRYLTYAINADNADAATRQLSRIETETSRILSSIGSKAHLMNGTERLSVIHSLLNPYKPFYFDYQTDISAKRAQTTKDCIAPTQIDFKPDGIFNDCFKLDNGIYGQVLVMKKFGSELSDRALADIVDLPLPMAVTWFVQPMEKSKAINFVRTRSAWIDKEIIEEQRSAVNKGYDFSILPQELKYSKDETEDVLDHLQNKNQRLYVFTGLIYTYAESKEALDSQVMQIISTARQNSIEVDTYDYRQRKGLNSVLPLGHNHVEISRMFTTAQVAILVPFATQELDDRGGNYYGQNKHSKNLVICNRKKLTSPMGFVCGKTGSGKGMFVKTEMTGTIFANPTDEIFIIDRAGEYTGITERYGGNTYHFGVGSQTYLNPFDTVSVEHLSRNEQIAFKIDAMLAQAGASAAEAGQNLSEADQSIIQRCVELAFDRAAQREDNLPPTLQDFYDIAREQPEHQAANIALRYERFVKGAMDFFNHQSNTDFNNRIIDFNLKDLPDSMLVFALINVCEAVRNRMYFNAKRGVRTWLYVEEMQSLFAYPTVLNYFSRFSNEGRKFGLLLTGITQNAVAMLNNKHAQNIVLNADFLMLLKQSPLDRMRWVELLNLSDQEEECIDETAEAGDGLLIAGNARVPIRGKFPQGNVLYDLFSTNPNETKKQHLQNRRSKRH
ncbi:ATP-binding protein [Streptococcus uberis]